MLLALLPFYAAAQQDTTKLRQVTISTSRAELLKSITPAQQLNSSQFIRYSAFNVADALRGFSGVNVKDYGGVGGLKTVSVRGLGANHTAVLLDGIQISDAENGQIDLGKFNLNNVQSITLFNGQSPDLLIPARSFASASVIAINTTKPALTSEKPYRITMGLIAGSFGLINPYLQWQQRLSNKWSFIVNTNTTNANGKYKYLTYNGSDYAEGERLGAAVRTQQVDGALYFNGNDSSKFNFRVNYYHADRGLPGAALLYVPPQQGQRLWNNDFFAQAGYQKKWDNGLRIMLNAKYANSYLHYLDPNFKNTLGYLDQQFRQHEYYQSAAVAYMLAKNWEISYAADIVINSMTANLPSFKYPTRTTVLNVIASNFKAGSFTLQGSLLNTNLVESVATGTTIPHRNVFSPTLVASFKLSEPLMLRAFYKSIFRVPTFNELYYNFITNTKLKPEFAHQYNVGAVYNKGLKGILDYITLTTDVYYNRVTDKIIYTPNVYAGSVFNIAKAEGLGADVGIRTEGKLGGAYKGIIAINYSYQRAMNISDPETSTYQNQLPYTPRHLLNVNAGVSKNGWGLYYNQMYSSLRFYNNNNSTATFDEYLPAYALADVSLIYKGKFSSLPVVLSAVVNNVFDQNYVVVRRYPMPGRSFRISFQITI
ncbi:outer membrane cobalamin receptor [Mucilaginibacter auburnensis]|uniref:Outer membrane cobalamin receptor n=2 Tax=Mucilaginibacter auburnensis TaxID=1457233 RepID=A0A2H9VLB4_9SPHI|nr:outer membrane cobalamin receptor [Mucilaginibacter auburnensis]